MNNNEWKKVCAACAEGTPPERCAYYGDPNGCNAPTLGAHPEGNLAERLQEALEKADRRIAELERAPGNAAAMRAALVECAKRIGIHVVNFKTGVVPPDAEAEAEKDENAHSLAFAALAAPARNCDVGTAEEQLARWENFCHRNWNSGYASRGLDPCDDCELVEYGNCRCQLAWAQMPFAPAEGVAK